MTPPDDPYASPPREQEATGARRAVPGQPWGPPVGRPEPGVPPAGAGRLGTAAVVVGLLSVLLAVTVLGGLALGTAALVLGARARARAAGGPSGTAVLGAALGVVGIVGALATWAWVQPYVEEYQGCRKESVSLAQDRECERRLRDSLPGG